MSSKLSDADKLIKIEEFCKNSLNDREKIIDILKTLNISTKEARSFKLGLEIFAKDILDIIDK